MNSVTISNTELSDLDFACSLFGEAIKYQKRKGYPEYRWDDREVQKQYIIEGCHYKVLLANAICAVFNIQRTDIKIWREKDLGQSLYLHGVLVNPDFKGRRIFGDILDWTIELAHREHKSSIRLDTWQNNPDLKNYYKSFEFYEVENFQIPATEDITLNCRGNLVTLMEYNIQSA